MKQSLDFQPDGFQSEEDLPQEEHTAKISVTRSRKGTLVQQQPKLHLPPANDIAAKVYNIAPDTITGWKPKLFLPRPVPLTFGYTLIDATLNLLDKPERGKEGVEVCYLGPREENSYYLHMNKSYPFPYSHIKAPQAIKLTNRRFLGNTNNGSNLKFDSMFESGNLDCAIRISEEEYDLYMRPDTNTKGYLQWFNFKVKNAKKRVVYKFNICNFQKHRSLYGRGMKPFVYSQKTMQYKKIGWQQAGENIKYERKPNRFLSEDYFSYRLSFQYEFEYSEDQIQFSYCVPYTYSLLLSFIDDLKKNSFVKVTKLTMSLGTLEVPLLTITQDNPKKQAIKRCIIISARTHPGESNSSYMMHGFLEFICGPSPQASFMRKNIIFMVIPMLNVDGVIAGNHRTGLSGKDFNRQFVNPDRYILPQISALKDLVVKSKQMYGKNLIFFLDFHGHSFKKNIFIYGPQYPIRENEYYESKIFPKMLGNQTNMFRYYSCVFRISQCKETTARAILFKKLNIPFAYTLEASNGYYYDKDTLKNVMFNERLWKEMGETIVKTIHKYCNELISLDLIKFEKERVKREHAEMKMRNKSLENKKKQALSSPIQKLTYKRPSIEVKVAESKTITEPEVLPSSFRDIVEEIKKEQDIILENPQFQKDASIGSVVSSQESNDQLPQEITEFIIKSVKIKKFEGLHAFSTYARFSEEKMKSLEQQEETITSFMDSPTKKSIELSPKKPQVYVAVQKSNSTRITLSKTGFPLSKSAQPRQRKSQTIQQSVTQTQQKYSHKSRVLNIETIRCKYLNVKGESLKRQMKQKQGGGNSFVDTFKKSYTYYKEKQLAPIFASDSLTRTFSRTTRKSYLFKEGKTHNYNSMLQQYI